MLIEQAVFTSASTDVAAGYHLVASSPGIDARDAREISVWSPSHESLCELPSPTASSVNFFRLAGGSYCVSKTQLAGGEYSGRGLRTYSNCLVVPPDVLLRFANNPFAVLRAAWAKGLLKVHQAAPPLLVPFQLAGRSALVDEGMLVELAERLGPIRLAQIVDAVIAKQPIVIVGAEKPEAALAGLINFFPVSCRSEISFTTGLKFSPRRPFQVHLAPHDPAETRRLSRQSGLTLIDLTAPVQDAGHIAGWGAFIAELAANDKLSVLVEQLLERPEGLHLADLNELGEHLRRELHNRSALAEQSQLLSDVIGEAIKRDVMDEEIFRRSISQAEPFETDTCRDTDLTRTPFDGDLYFHHLGDEASEDQLPRRSMPHDIRRENDVQRTFRAAHAPHANTMRQSQPTGVEKHGCQPPARTLGPDCPKLVEKLEKLDDVVYDAINGDPRALEEVTRLWPELLAELGPKQIEESREQYLRYSLSIWEHCLDEGLRDADRAVSSLNVLCLLFNEE